MKRLITWIPEVYLLLAVAAYWLFSGTLFNPVAFVFILLLALQLVIKNIYLGLVIAAVLAVLHFYLFAALASELHKFPSYNQEAARMLWTGTVYFGANLIMSMWMAIKYMRLKSAGMKAGI